MGAMRVGSAVVNAVPYGIYNGKKIAVKLSVFVVFIFTIYHIADYFWKIN